MIISIKNFSHLNIPVPNSKVSLTGPDARAIGLAPVLLTTLLSRFSPRYTCRRNANHPSLQGEHFRSQQLAASASYFSKLPVIRIRTMPAGCRICYPMRPMGGNWRCYYQIEARASMVPHATSLPINTLQDPSILNIRGISS